MLTQRADVLRDARVGVVSERIWRGISATVAHAIWSDDVEAQGGEEGDLIAPAERHVGEAVDEDNGAAVRDGGRARGVDVAVGFTVEVGGAELDARVVEGFELVGSSHNGVGVSEERMEC